MGAHETRRGDEVGQSWGVLGRAAFIGAGAVYAHQASKGLCSLEGLELTEQTEQDEVPVGGLGGVCLWRRGCLDVSSIASATADTVVRTPVHIHTLFYRIDLGFEL